MTESRTKEDLHIVSRCIQILSRGEYAGIYVLITAELALAIQNQSSHPQIDEQSSE